MGKKNGARALVIGYNGIDEIEVNDLNDMQRAVGGYIERFSVPLIDGVDLYIDDEGLFSQPANRAILANKTMEEMGYLRQFTFSDYEGDVVKCGEYYTVLHGPILAIGYDPETGDKVPLSDEQVSEVCEAFLCGGPMGIGSGRLVETMIKLGL